MYLDLLIPIFSLKIIILIAQRKYAKISSSFLVIKDSFNKRTYMPSMNNVNDNIDIMSPSQTPAHTYAAHHTHVNYGYKNRICVEHNRKLEKNTFSSLSR